MDNDNLRGVFKITFIPYFMDNDNLRGVFKNLSSNHRWEEYSVANIRAWVLIEGNFGEELGNFEKGSVAAENLFSVEIFLGQRGNFSTV